mmetsp:Transcript_12580/g.29549  ORF Transcript_12580/g.29549 Transcript_12580/m.29549 type:complete len:205 (+) Transcript_12580:58-672(+)
MMRVRPGYSCTCVVPAARHEVSHFRSASTNHFHRGHLAARRSVERPSRRKRGTFAGRRGLSSRELPVGSFHQSPGCSHTRPPEEVLLPQGSAQHTRPEEEVLPQGSAQQLSTSPACSRCLLYVGSTGTEAAEASVPPLSPPMLLLRLDRTTLLLQLDITLGPPGDINADVTKEAAAAAASQVWNSCTSSAPASSHVRNSCTSSE